MSLSMVERRKLMLIAKCKKCGHAEKVPDEYAGKILTCPCGNKVYLPIPKKHVHASKKPVKATFGRLEFLMHIIASTCIGSLSSAIFGNNPVHIFIGFIGIGIWQFIVTAMRLDDAGFSRIHLVPFIVVWPIGIISAAAMSHDIRLIFGMMLFAIGIWELGVFLACLVHPSKCLNT